MTSPAAPPPPATLPLPADAPAVALVALAVPAPHVLLLTLNRPAARNAVSPALAADVARALAWFDAAPDLWVAVITGAGSAFCAGADLKAWRARQDAGLADEAAGVAAAPAGFAHLSRRAASAKPLVAAVNGPAHGGGAEIVLNCDVVVADARATFALPEVTRGVVAAMGGIPRLAAIAGHQRASELLLTGRSVSAAEAHARFGFVNEVVPRGTAVAAAVAWAQRIAANSPDAVAATKRALLLAQEGRSFEGATIAAGYSAEGRRVYAGWNIREGLRAFAERRAPQWRSPAKL